MTFNMFAVVIDCTDPRLQANFWAEVLSYDVRERNPDEYLVSDPTGTASPLYFMKVPEPKVGKNRFHLDRHPRRRRSQSGWRRGSLDH